ncbi:MAG: hypothetical protein R3B41_02495 [Candidatus Doudnabacteria bacterium]
MLNKIDWGLFFSQKYWFGINSGQIHLIDQTVLVVGAAMVLVAVAVWIARFILNIELLKATFAKITRILLIIGLVEMLWFLLRTQNVSVLSSRFVAVGIAVVGVLWLIAPLRYLLFRYRLDQVVAEKQLLKEKYLKLK